MSLLPDPKVARQQSLYPTDGCFTAVMADLDEMLDHESDSGIPQSHRDATPNALEHGIYYLLFAFTLLICKFR